MVLDNTGSMAQSGKMTSAEDRVAQSAHQLKNAARNGDV